MMYWTLSKLKTYVPKRKKENVSPPKYLEIIYIIYLIRYIISLMYLGKLVANIDHEISKFSNKKTNDLTKNGQKSWSDTSPKKII